MLSGVRKDRKPLGPQPFGEVAVPAMMEHSGSPVYFWPPYSEIKPLLFLWSTFCDGSGTWVNSPGFVHLSLLAPSLQMASASDWQSTDHASASQLQGRLESGSLVFSCFMARCEVESRKDSGAEKSFINQKGTQPLGREQRKEGKMWQRGQMKGGREEGRGEMGRGRIYQTCYRVLHDLVIT